MEPDFNYNSVPHGFAHCFKKQCKHSANCLHYLAALHATPECKYIHTLNPAYVASIGEDCPHFSIYQKQKFALGITHLFDKLLHSEAVIIKQQMIDYFNRSTYYRLWRKERLITPKEQKGVQEIFLSRGITDAPLYDEYVEQYDW